MTMIDQLRDRSGTGVIDAVTTDFTAASSGDDEFRRRLEGPIYEENTDVARFLLTTLSEDSMTKETRTDLWARRKGALRLDDRAHPAPGRQSLRRVEADAGRAAAAAAAQEIDVHKLGNLTITAYNRTLGNKSFVEKRDRTDARGNFIGYRNGLALNNELADREIWRVADISDRTAKLADKVLSRFPVT